MTQLPGQPNNMMLSAPAAGQGTQPVTQPNTMGAPVQTQLDPTSPAGPGQGGAATAQGVQAVMGQEQAEIAQPGQDMAMQSGQPVAPEGEQQQQQPPPPSLQGNPAWNPGTPNQFSQTGLLYGPGQGPVTAQVPGMNVMAEYHAPEAIGSVKGAQTPSGDLELLTTGTSSRFRDRVRGKSGSVEHVGHTIAPKGGQDGGTGDTNLSKMGHSGQNLASAGPVTPLLGKGLAAARNFIHVNEKHAQELGPEDTHRLNHETDGPMKLSAVGESGLIMGVRPWNVQGEDAWPTSQPIGRSPATMGHSKLADGLGKDMLNNAGRTGISPILGTGGLIGAGLAGGAGLASGYWNQTAGRLGAPKAPTDAFFSAAGDSLDYAGANAADFGRSTGLTGLENTRAQPGKPLVSTANQKLKEIQNRPGVSPGIRRTSEISKNVADAAGNLATVAVGGGGLTGTASQMSKAPGFMSRAAPAVARGGRVLNQSARTGAKGMGIGATIDTGSAIAAEPGENPTNLTKPLAALGAVSPILGTVPGKLGLGLSAMTHPVVAAPTMGAWSIGENKLDAGIYKGMGDRVQEQGTKAIQDNKGVMDVIEAKGLTPEQAMRQFSSGEMDMNTLMSGAVENMSPEGLKRFVIGMPPETLKGLVPLMSPEQLQAVKSGLSPEQLQSLGAGTDKSPTQAAEMFGLKPEQAEEFIAGIAEKNGIQPTEVTLEHVQPEVSAMFEELKQLEAMGGGDENSVFGRITNFIGGMLQGENVIQGLLIGGAILSAIVGLVGGMAGSKGIGAAGLLGALGMGAGAYMNNPETMKGLIGIGKPGDTSTQATTADAVGAPTPDQVDQKATDAGVEGIPGVRAPAQNAHEGMANWRARQPKPPMQPAM